MILLSAILIYIGTERPALKYLNNYVRIDVGKKWYDLGVQLLDQEDEETLSTIEANYRGDIDKCVTEMFRLWTQRKPEASWNNLIDALRQPGVKLDALAKNIEDMLCEGICIINLI